jgi:1,5-anhydro-D-fructose reductase (1,5-anhydro-D-mannitol-forming)
MSQRPIGEVTLSNADGQTQLLLEMENLYVRGLREFHSAVRGRGRPAATAADGVWSLAAALAVLESARTGRAVKIMPGI